MLIIMTQDLACESRMPNLNNIIYNKSLNTSKILFYIQHIQGYYKMKTQLKLINVCKSTYLIQFIANTIVFLLDIS